MEMQEKNFVDLCLVFCLQTKKLILKLNIGQQIIPVAKRFILYLHFTQYVYPTHKTYSSVLIFAMDASRSRSFLKQLYFHSICTVYTGLLVKRPTHIFKETKVVLFVAYSLNNNCQSHLRIWLHPGLYQNSKNTSKCKCSSSNQTQSPMQPQDYCTNCEDGGWGWDRMAIMMIPQCYKIRNLASIQRALWQLISITTPTR